MEKPQGMQPTCGDNSVIFQDIPRSANSHSNNVLLRKLSTTDAEQ